MKIPRPTPTKENRKKNLINGLLLLALAFISTSISYIFWTPFNVISMLGFVLAFFYWLFSIPFFAACLVFEEELKIETVRTKDDPLKKKEAESKFCNKNSALVLCGGGGKGAYQAGCLYAFEDAGIHFSHIAGSSIGAINGAFFIANGIEETRSLWTKQSSGIFNLRLNRLFNLFLRLFAINAMYIEIPKRKRLVFAIGFFGLNLSYAIVGSQWVVSEHFFLGVIGGLFIFNFFYFLPVVIWTLCEHFGLVIIDNKRFSGVLADHLKVTNLKNSNMKFYVTVSKQVEKFDPDKPRPFGAFKLTRSSIFIPEYIDLAEESDENIIDYLLASANVPFGVMEKMQIGDNYYVDGGVTDNAPILPILDYDINSIFIVHTNPHGKANRVDIRSRAGLMKRLKEIKWLIELNNRSSNELMQKYRSKYKNFLLRFLYLPSDRSSSDITLKIPEIKAKIYHFYPSQSLGSLLKSMLFQSSERTNFLIKLGYNDTIKKIRKIYS